MTAELDSPTTSAATTLPLWRGRRGLAARLLVATRALEVTIDGLATHQLHLAPRTPGAGMDRISTVVTLTGAEHEGRGEDVAYAAATQDALPGHLTRVLAAIRGTHTLGELSTILDGLGPIVPPAAVWDDKDGYHRWAVEAAMLDLALRQADTDLAALVQAPWQPVRTVLSMGLGTPPSPDVLDAWLARDASVQFKLDVSMAWDVALTRQLADRAAAIPTIDFKALYHGDWIDNDFPPSLYRAVAEALPEALLEDVRLDADTNDALDEGGLTRLSWDYPITQPSDVPGLPRAQATFADVLPAAINIKPSRFGSIERLLGTIALCDEARIPCYAGGQYELGIGRTQVQAIASICFPEAPNDCAPVMFHGAQPSDADLPLGAIVPPSGAAGFGWDAPTPAATQHS